MTAGCSRRPRAWPALAAWPGGLLLALRMALTMALTMALAASMAAAHAQGLSAPATVTLDDRQGAFDLWPQVRMLVDPGQRLDLAQVRQQDAAFVPPTTAARTLGMRDAAIWLRIPVSVAPDSDGVWVLDIDYPVINQVDVFVLRSGALVHSARTGNLVPRQQRPIDGRTLAVGLTLTPGADHLLYLRVQSSGALILPISLAKPSAFLQRALAEQMLQGVLLGVGLCLLVYSLGQCLMLGEPLFAKYALLISGSILFCLLHFGVGAQFLWPDNRWMELHLGGLSALIAATGSFLFIEQVLRGADMGPRMSRLMKAGAAATGGSAVLYATGLLTLAQVTAIVSVLGLAPALLGLPGALRRARRGDPVGHSFLLAWAVYFAVTWVTIEVIKGRIDANFWTQHAFQFGATLDMLIFMRVLGLQTRALKLSAQAARRERDSLHSMAHTDALTGLPNRRVLHAALASAIERRRPHERLAVTMLDLDGFKQVNDQHGHAIGDALLVAVARRLQANLRSSDLISRIGGDEFLVLSTGLTSREQVRELSDKLVRAIGEPLQIDGRSYRVGLTAGYAIAPDDGLDPAELIRRADAAMYAGKREGKGRVGSTGAGTAGAA